MKAIHLSMLLSLFLLKPIVGLATAIAVENNHTIIDTKSIALPSFTTISVAQGIKVIVLSASENKAIIASNYLDKVSVEVKNSGLEIRYVNENRLNLKNPHTVVKLYVQKAPQNYKVTSSAKIQVQTMLTSNQMMIQLSSSGSLVFEQNVQATNLNAKISSSGVLRFASLKTTQTVLELSSSADLYVSKLVAEELHAELSSSASVNVSSAGMVKNMILKSSSSASFDAENLNLSSLDIDASSSAKISVGEVSSTLNAKASSSAKVRFKNRNALVNKRVSSGATIVSY